MGDMTRVIVLTRDIAAPPEVVWRVLTELDRAPERLRSIRRVERLAGPDYGVGTSWRETRRMFGQEASEEMTVTKLVPGVSTTVEARSAGTHYVSSFHVAAGPRGGSTLTFEFSGRPDGPQSITNQVMLRVMGGVGMVATRKVMRDDLDDLARAAESEARRP